MQTLPRGDPLSDSHGEKRNKDTQRHFIIGTWKRRRPGPCKEMVFPAKILPLERSTEVAPDLTQSSVRLSTS